MGSLAAAVLLLAAAPARARAQEPHEKRLELRIAELANVAISGVQAGWLIGGAIVTSPRRQELEYSRYVDFQQGFLEASTPWAPMLMPLALVANATALVLLWPERDEPAFWLTAAGLAFQIGVAVAAFFLNVPANTEVESWSATGTPPPDWRDVRDQWETGQLLRTIFATAAFGSNTAAATLF